MNSKQKYVADNRDEINRKQRAYYKLKASGAVIPKVRDTCKDQKRRMHELMLYDCGLTKADCIELSQRYRQEA
jgi:hypothetical protein